MPKGVPNKRYTPEFKRMVVETMKKGHLSIYTAMQEFGINDHKIIERWERIYLEEGSEGLAIERRGRSSKGQMCIRDSFGADGHQLMPGSLQSRYQGRAGVIAAGIFARKMCIRDRCKD